MADAETTVEWQIEIDRICRRFEELLRSGETMGDLDPWLQLVPTPIQGQLKLELEKCQSVIDPHGVDTRVLSDAALHCDRDSDGLFSADGLSFDAAARRCPTFQGLSSAARHALFERFELRSFDAGSELLAQGGPARGLHLIVRGSVDIIDTESGARIDADGAGSVLGEMSLLTGQPCSATVLATSDVEALVLSTDGYELLRGDHPELEIALSQLVSDRLGGRKHDALCGKRMGGYRLERCISRGGMGVVYEANRPPDGERVALKMLRHRFIYDDKMQSRFSQEAQLLEDLMHPNIISFHGHFVAYRTRFLVLDYCDGSDLFHVVRDKGPLNEETVRAILGQIAEGLMYAQDSGVIHRDIKPGNVLVDRDGRVRLTDFGLSKLLENEVRDRTVVGTPSYMPPEQFRGENVDVSCDWYALGCLACEMLTGRILFPGSDWRMLYAKKTEAIPNDLWPEIDVSPELRELIHGSLQPDQANRRLDLEKLSHWAEGISVF